MITTQTRCAICGKVYTVRKKREPDDMDYPILHKAYAAGYTCKGTFLPGMDINETAANVAIAGIKKILGLK